MTLFGLSGFSSTCSCTLVLFTFRQGEGLRIQGDAQTCRTAKTRYTEFARNTCTSLLLYVCMSRKLDASIDHDRLPGHIV